ncbi:MAG: hypothetical protein CL908_22730 [Deltaproteobacteria bacterium]|nr:hypothetical protein [Deltaproteobacteria bacterium]
MDIRGRWPASTGFGGHIERIEQCGDRRVVTSSGPIYVFHADGTLENGSRGVEALLYIDTQVSVDFVDLGIRREASALVPQRLGLGRVGRGERPGWLLFTILCLRWAHGLRSG